MALFRQDQHTSGLYRVNCGCVTLQRISLNGDRLVLHRAISGGYFAEASIFSDLYHCDAICTEAGSVLKIAKADVIGMMRSNPEFCEGFTRFLAVQIQQYRTLLEILAIRSAKERVLTAVQAGYLNGTILEFSSRINLTHEACYRAFRELCDDGRMTQKGRGQYVLQRA